ncbi:MAG TPA: BTAD domain-containing putative transcriptional regulator [Actinospica sp.]|nr:BTAD domain-containing putative transcriptional regulator [Actinospica sp.]
MLGPLLVEHEGSQIPVSAGRERLVLGAMLVRPNRVVSCDALIDAVWESDPPASAQVTLRNHVRRLRQTLGPAVAARIVTRHSGYLMEIGDEEYDLLAFTRLCRRGQAAGRRGEWAAAIEDLDGALSLWRGEPLADVCSPSVRETEAARIEEMRLEALESRFDAQLAVGGSGDLVADLRQLVARHPLRERFHAQLMLALYRAGRQGEALSSYQSARRVLSGELGVQPGPVLQSLQARILRADPELLAPDPATARGPAPPADPPVLPAPPAAPAPAEDRPGRLEPSPLTPRQLPTAPGHFVGREGDLKALAESVARAADGTGTSSGTVTIAVVHGTAGIGKTTLVLHCAHQAADRFPDGQLYVNLRGFDPVGQPMPPAEAVRGFIDAFGVPVSQIPTSGDAQVALYRSLLADKRVLVVLDNAGDVDQVRPLLPGNPTCLVLVTSRNALPGLVAAEGAQSVPLDVLTAAEARDLLGARLRAEQIAADSAALTELVDLCAGLPLALGIVAARAATHARLPLTALAAELRDAHRRLDALDIGDQTTDVRAAMSWSYRGLGREAARLFRLLTVQAGPDISLPAAASLAAVPPDAANRALTELTRASLLTEHVPGRFSLHDLLRAYAAEQVIGETERREAVHRVLDHYLRTGEKAAMLLNPTRDTVVLPPAQPGVTPECFDSGTHVMEWFETEYHVLLAAIEQAAATGFDVHGWQLPRVMHRFFDRRGHWHDWVASYLIGLTCAERLGDRDAQVYVHRGLGTAYVALNSLEDAYAHYLRSLELSRQLGDPVGQANAHRSLSLASELQHRDAQAHEHSRQALELFTAAGHVPGRAHALNDLGWSYAHLGDFEAAVDHCRQGLELLSDLGDEDGQAATYDSLAYAHHRLGRTDEAAECYQQALIIYRRLGDRYRQARTLTSMGRLAKDVGDVHAAREQLRRALAILDEIGHPEAKDIRAELRDLL